MARLFGTDGVRGVANTDLTPELAYKMGRAAAAYFGWNTAHPLFWVGRDPRISGTMLEAALCAGICSAGGHARQLGVVPTPGVAYLTRTSDAVAGVVISASHNPFLDNGIKFFGTKGYKLPDSVEDEIEKLIESESTALARPTGEGVGVVVACHEKVSAYADYLCGLVKEDLSGLKIVIDCANGAAYEVAPEVFHKLGIDTVVLHNKPDGVNINHHCGSTHTESLQTAVKEHGADLGLAFDGDADRCLAVDENGEMVDGDQIMLILAQELIKSSQLKDNVLVTTVMSNLGLHQAIRKLGGKCVVTGVGDRYVLEAMREHGYGLGGEQSGHIIFGQHSTTGDGLLTALQLLIALKRSSLKLSKLAGLMTRFPQILVNVRVGNKEGWDKNPAIQQAVQKAEKMLGEDGRVLVRASGTESLIRVMAEGPVLADLEQLAADVVAVVEKELN